MQTTEPSINFCDHDFSVPIENLKLVLQLLYLVPSAVFQARIIYILVFKHRKKYRRQSFFMIFLADVVTAFLLVLNSIFFTRPMMYLPQTCEFLLNFLQNHHILLDIYYPILRYLQAFQILIQVLFIANRASCVLFPVRYSLFWKKWLRRILWTLAVLPSFWVWTIVISEKVVRHAYGGLFIIYVRYFGWARSVFFFAVLRGVSVILIVSFSVVTVIKMAKMKKRIKESERRLCWASVYLSLCYFTPAVTEYLYSRTTSALSNDHYLYGVTLISWDIQNIGSSYIMLLFNPPFRKHIFQIFKKNTSKEKPHHIKVTSLSHG